MKLVELNALGWTLFHLLWEGSAVALGLTVALSFARSARVRYAAACAALGLVLSGFVFTFVHLSVRGPVAGGTLALSLRSTGAGLPYFGSDPTSAGSMDLAAWAAALWLAGVLIFYLRAAGGWLAIRRWRNTGVCAPDGEWPIRFSELQKRLRVSAPVVLLQSTLADVPVVMGYLRPVILLPLGLLAGMPERQIEYILMHELAHIRRHDYLVNLLQTLAEGFLFYHPAVWWISGVIRAERENCCDDVVAGYGDAHEYAATLAALEGYRQGGREAALAATGGNLMKRIRRLLKQPEGPRAALKPIFSAGLIVISVGIALAYQANQTGQTGVENAYKKWLNEDVAYIITQEERAAFLNLGSNAERERMIEQFWKRRDPTPGTEENEFKEEHYRRIAYANERYAAQSVAGWKTDRGRIYITFGPPDEIDSHPSGGTYRRPPEQGGGATTVYPFEQWRYRYIEGIGNQVSIEFVDTTLTGEYRMTMDPGEKERVKNPGN